MTDATETISIVRIFDAPRDLVFQNWVRTEDISTCFAPKGFTVNACEVDARPGQRWWVEFRSPTGEVHREFGEFREIKEPEKLIFTLTQQDSHGNTGPQTLVTVTLAEQGSKTEMTFLQTGYEAATMRDGNAEGWTECFDKLDVHVAARR
ncbi:SRPBCC family protein [Actinopolymorpha alba]|uniref:SRPBCC family protein n=1 Tax=Actinopolymorpha alba TaxID=533267 RepID=UPI00036A0924|nr:SRPBCC domain-containing protein [Actinopolymorpha alba]